MIKIDLSKAFSLRIFVYLLGLIPGAFFAVSVALGDPETTRNVIGTASQIYPFPPYALLIIFLACSLFVGHVFILMAWFVEVLLNWAYRTWQFVIRKTFGSYRFYRWLGIIQQKWPKRGIVVQLFSMAVMAARIQRRYSDARPVMRCVAIVAEKLLKKRYGIDVIDAVSQFGEEWQVWYSVLGKPPKSIQETVMAMRTMLGCGLAGFSALLFAPCLVVWYFLAICGVFTITGLGMTWSVFRWKTDPVRLNYLRLQSMLLDLFEVRDRTTGEEAATE